MIKKLGQLYEKHNTAINIFLFVLTIASTIFGVYTYSHPADFSPKLSVIIESRDNYLVRGEKQIKDIKITYKGKELGKDSLSLLVKKITITNLGKAPIKLNDYSLDDFKIKIFNGKIIATEPIPDKFNNLLSYSLQPKILDSISIIFNKLVFNPKESVSFNTYILVKPKGKLLDYYAFGKIAGQSNISVLFDNELEEETDWSDIFYTIFWILAFFVIVISIVAIIVFIIEFLTSYFRKTIILQKLGFPLKELNTTQIAFVEVYRHLKKSEFLYIIKGLANNPNFIKEQEDLCKAFDLINSNRKKKIENDFIYLTIRDIFYENDLIRIENKEITFLSETLMEEAKKTLNML